MIKFNPPSTSKLQLRDLWFAAVAVRDTGNHGELGKQLLELARKTGVLKAACEHHKAAGRPWRFGEEDVAHVIRFGLRGLDPWLPGEFNV